MERQSWALVTLVAAGALTLGACSKQADGNPNAQGSPGTGNGVNVARPVAPDGPPGGPSGVAGSLPHTGSSGGDAVPGTTGSGTAAGSGRSQTAQPGAGLNGGLGGSNSVMGSSSAGGGSSSESAGSSPVGNGSSNATPGSAVGSRP